MDIKVVGKENCVFCERAKKLLTIRKKEFEYFDVADEGFDFTKFREDHGAMGARTFPVVVIDGEYIGGFTELFGVLNEQSNS